MLYAALRRVHHALPRPLWRLSAFAVDGVRRIRYARERRRARRATLEYSWERRLRHVDPRVRTVFVELPEHSIGLDLTGGELVRPRALTVADAEDMELVDGSCDYVWAGVLPADPTRRRRIEREIARVLRPGCFAFVEHSSPTIDGLEEIDVRRSGSLATRLLRLRLTHRVFRKPPYPVPERRTRPLALYFIPTQSYWLLDIVRTRETVQTINRLGVDTATVDVEAIKDPDSAAAKAIVAARPDFATSVNLNYYLASRIGSDEVVAGLDLPATLVWDDPVGALTGYLNWERHSTMGDLGPETADPLPRFKQLLRGPNVRHVAADTGHVEAMCSLDLVERDAVMWHPFPTFPPFLEQGRRGPVEPRYDVAFGGNIYEALTASSAFASKPDYFEITDRIRIGKLADLGRSVWELLEEALDDLPPDRRSSLGLVPTSTVFWDYYLYVSWFATTTAVRIELLTSVPRPVHVFGLFADPASVELLRRRPNLVYEGHKHNFKELPETLAATKINLCVSQALIYKGLPSKFLDCVAAGGFGLVDYKDDLVRLFGPVVEHVMFRTGDEMNAKIEYFLPRDAERRELVEELRQVVERECNLEAAMSRIYAAYI